METKRSIDDIKEFDEKFQKITDGPTVIPGSLFLLSSDVMHRWGIDVTEENRAELRELCETARLSEVSKRDDSPELERIVRPQMREWIEPRMARHIGDIAKELALSFSDCNEEIHICDMPARNGMISGTIALAMDERLLAMSKFHLVDSSEARLNDALENMKRRGASGSANLRNDSTFMKETQDSRFDMVVSLSHLHHISFLHEYLLEIRRMLKDGGVFIMGDRHSAIFDSPFHTADLLEAMGSDEKAIKAFRKHIGTKRLEPDPDVRITQEELEAIRNHKEYWMQILDAFRKTRPDTPLPKISFLEAHDTSEARRQKLEKAGFITDPAQIRKAFPRLVNYDLPKKLMRGSDFSVVTVAMKSTPRG